MKNALVYSIPIFALGLLFGGCSQDDVVLPDQQKRIVSYLESTHSPRLIPESDTDPTQMQAFYTTSGDAVYRYIDLESYYNPSRPDSLEVTSQSTVSITFSAYVFNYNDITTSGQTVTMPYFTNDPLLEQAFIDAGLTTEFWSFEPKVIDMKRTDIIKGLYLALLGCRAGDRVEAYMTYTMAYGDDNFSIIPRQSPIAIFFTVNSVQ